MFSKVIVKFKAERENYEENWKRVREGEGRERKEERRREREREGER